MSKNVEIRIFKTVILPLILYGCEIWSLTLREEHRPRIFENRVLRRREMCIGYWQESQKEREDS
jgi:hypothetical protein